MRVVVPTLPVDDGVDGSITFRDGAFIRKYQKTGCVLGTVFQDQAFFAVRRENDDLEKSRVVYLACGYDAEGDGGQSEERKRFKRVGGNPKPIKVTLGKGQHSVLFSVPRPFDRPFDSGGEGSDSDRVLAGQRIRCSVDTAASGIQGGTLTEVITVSEYLPQSNTFHKKVYDMLPRSSVAVEDVAELRVDEMAAALFYTYIWGWYTGFIEMPYYSIQGLLTNPPVNLTGGSVQVTQDIQENQEELHRYRLLSLLFADESDPRFETKHFGFLTPLEAFDEYKRSYDGRFNDYFGRALGGFLELVPAGSR